MKHILCVSFYIASFLWEANLIKFSKADIESPHIFQGFFRSNVISELSVLVILNQISMFYELYLRLCIITPLSLTLNLLKHKINISKIFQCIKILSKDYWKRGYLMS